MIQSQVFSQWINRTVPLIQHLAEHYLIPDKSYKYIVLHFQLLSKSKFKELIHYDNHAILDFHQPSAIALSKLASKGAKTETAQA